MIGFNQLPCFFKSHLQIYSFDDFTYGEDISQHSSAIIAHQSDVIIYCHIIDDSHIKKVKHNIDSRRFVSIPVAFSYGNQLIEGKKALLVDDPYPTKICTAVNSVSYGIASKHLSASIVPLPNEVKVTTGTIYWEPTEKE